MTPALASSRTAAWVMEVPVPSSTVVVLARGDVPEQGRLARFGHVLHASAIDQQAAMLQVVEIGPFGVEDGLEVGWREIVHEEAWLLKFK